MSAYNLIPSELTIGLHKCARSLTKDESTSDRVALEIFERIRALPDACNTIGCEGSFKECTATLSVAGKLVATLEVAVQFWREGSQRVTVADVRRCATKMQAKLSDTLGCVLYDAIEFVALDEMFQCTFEFTVSDSDVPALCAASVEREERAREEIRTEMKSKRTALLLDAELARAKVLAERRSLASAAANHVPRTRSRRSKRGAKLRQVPVRTIPIPSIGAESSFARHLARKEKAIARIRSASMFDRTSAYVRSVFGFAAPKDTKESQSEFGLSHAGDADLFEGI